MGSVAADGDVALARLCDSAGRQADEALALLAKLLENIAEHPAEPKYKRLKPDNPKLKEGLLRFAGAADFLRLAGFVAAQDGSLEFGGAAGADALRGACALIQQRRKGLREDPIASAYRTIVQSGAHSAGLAEVEALAGSPAGQEALRTLEKVLENVRRYPDSERYRCVSLAKAATQKLLAAAPLMKIIGFVEDTLPTGEAAMKLGRLDLDVLHRYWAMVMWAVHPPQPMQLGGNGSSKHLDRALGAVLGAAIGDALGAPLGGRGPFEVTAVEVDKALEMCGGGRWGVAPGQATGLTECAVCLAEALAEMPPQLRALPDEDLAARYGRWGQSQPFHAERACRQVFQRPLSLAHLLERAKELNQKSMGTGALTRCVPIAVLAAAVAEPAAAVALARADAALSHPDPTVGNASAAYAATIAQLIIAGDGDRRRALEALQAWILSEAKAARSGGKQLAAAGGQGGWTHLPKTATPEGQAPQWSPPGEHSVALDVVAEWLQKAFTGDGELVFSSFAHDALLDGDVGSVEIPLKHAFRLLKEGVSFEDAMRRMLAGGGDSCTNASAVGGLLGAAVGLSGLPARWVRAVLACDVDAGQFRPPEYRACRLPELVQRILAKTA